MNRKGQIATAMLVIIALAFSAFALYSIISFKDGFGFRSSELDGLTRKVEGSKTYITAQAKEFGKKLTIECPACSEDQILQKGKDYDAAHKARTEKDGNFFAKLRNGEFNFTNSNNIYKLEVKGVQLEVSSGYNKVVETFDICQTFDKEGNDLGGCERIKETTPDNTTPE
ncbi:MAG: hypothetical protein ABH864_07410 [archaeon]